MSYNKSELYSACLEVAENTLWDHENPPKHQEVKDLADVFFEEADHLGEGIDGSGLCSNENPIIPAVRYIAYSHAIPPMGRNTDWFYPTLQVIIEFCCPNTIHTDRSSEIFYYLKKGINKSQSEVEVRVDKKEKEDIDKLLDKLDSSLKSKRIGAWQTFNSDNPDRLSQATNSMVELLDRVIGILCKEQTFAEFLERNLESQQEIKWAESMRKFIGDTKSNLHRIKHYKDYSDENMTETILTVSEKLIHLLLVKDLSSNT